MISSGPATTRRTAIIAVHGVGSPPRFSTARSVADLLSKYLTGRTRYGPFIEHHLLIPTAPVGATTLASPIPPPRPKRSLLASLFGRVRRDRTRLTRADGAPAAADVAFMREQLRGYQSSNEPYETVELEGERHDSGETHAIHVFEMHWSDLSHVGMGIFRILGAAYQLILHVCQLGRKTLDVAAQYAPDPRDQKLNESWQSLSTWHAWAVRLFTTGVPVATLLMLLFPLLFLPAAIPPRPPATRLLAGLLLAEVALLATVGVLMFRVWRRPNAATWYVAASLSLIGAGVWLYWRAPTDAATLGAVLTTGTLGVLLVAAFEGVLRSYESSRPGALVAGRSGLAAVLLLTAWKAHLIDGVDYADCVRQAAFVAFQWSWVLLMVVWAVLWAFVVGSLILSVRVRLRTPKGASRLRAERATWTARMTLAFTLFCFIVAALVAFQAMVNLAASYEQQVNIFPSDVRPRVVDWLVPDPSDHPHLFFSTLVAQTATSGLPFAMSGAALALGFVVWFFALIAITSLRAPRPESHLAVPLGHWVTQGFLWLRPAGELLAIAIIVSFAVGGVHDLVTGALPAPDPQRDRIVGSSGAIIQGLAYALLVSAATIAAVRLRLDAIASRTRPAIGILLDVDNYLRESPETATPRARIAERFASLLRYVENRRDTDGDPFFDRIVLIAHSQGSVITADLLRYLSLERIAEPRIDPDRYRLLTMGSPLRQLYAANFPDLYRWVDFTDDFFHTPAESDLRHRSPMVTTLRVGQWVHLYTTGDYIGRPLWRSVDSPRVWERQSFAFASTGDRRRERCLGAGAHTQYWQSPDVAQELDALMA